MGIKVTLTDYAVKLINDGEFSGGRITGIASFEVKSILTTTAVEVQAVILHEETLKPLVVIGPALLPKGGGNLTLHEWIVGAEYELPKPPVPSIKSKEEFGKPGIIQSEPKESA